MEQAAKKPQSPPVIVNREASKPIDEPDYTYVSIGGHSYGIPPLTFKRIKKIWPLLDELQELPDPTSKELTPRDLAKHGMRRQEIVIQIFAVGLSKLHPDLTADEIEERMTNRESMVLLTKFSELMQKSGMVPEGEIPPAGANVPQASPVSR